MAIITNTQAELGYELISVIPYAYHHHLKGDLDTTVSCLDTDPFYYFSPNHMSLYDIRVDGTAVPAIYPNSKIHRKELDLKEWAPPPYREVYQNDIFKFDKPILLVSNKYNDEWRAGPFNFIDIESLLIMLEPLVDKYQIIYNRFTVDQAPTDSAEHYHMPDFEALEEAFGDKVITVHQLVKQHPEFTYNELILRLFANTDKFISVQGGTSILSSYFGGTNIIFAVRGGEVEHGTYNSWYDKFAGTKIIHVKSYLELKDTVAETY